MSFPVILLFLYGVILIVGGLMGYMKAKSRPSLIAGVSCGVIALLLGFIYYVAWPLAPIGALALSALLIAVMGKRYLNNRKPMPAIPIIALSLFVAIVQLYVLI